MLSPALKSGGGGEDAQTGDMYPYFTRSNIGANGNRYNFSSRMNTRRLCSVRRFACFLAPKLELLWLLH